MLQFGFSSEIRQKTGKSCELIFSPAWIGRPAKPPASHRGLAFADRRAIGSTAGSVGGRKRRRLAISPADRKDLVGLCQFHVRRDELYDFLRTGLSQLRQSS
jgi:hypothetical protein